MKSKGILTAFCMLQIGCSTHYLNKQDLVQQLYENGRKVFIKGCQNGVCMMKSELGDFPIVSSRRLDSISRGNPDEPVLAWIDFMGLKEIQCRNKDGKRVKVGVDHNSQLLLFDKEGNKVQFYFQTGRYENGKFYGLRSVILGIERTIDEKEVDSIELYSEFKVERPVGPGYDSKHKDK